MEGKTPHSLFLSYFVFWLSSALSALISPRKYYLGRKLNIDPSFTLTHTPLPSLLSSSLPSTLAYIIFLYIYI